MRRRLARLPGVVVGLALMVSVARPGAAAVIEGTVALPEVEPPPVTSSRYPGEVTYQAGPPDPAVAVVALEGAPAQAPGAQPAPVEMAQHHYQFAPGVLAVRTGSVVRFPNRDDEYHSVFSYSQPKRFDLGRYRRDETPAELVFDQPGVVKLFCEIHEHMRGTIVVLDTPYFQKTDANGRYRLEGLPAGRFVLKAWVGDEVRERPVELAEDGTLQVDFPAE